MRKILFIGADGTGRTHSMLVIGKVLADLNNEVIVIDNTRSKGVFNYFEYNSDLENNNSNEIVRENITIKCNIDDINEIEKLKADYVLIEDDKNNFENLNDFFKVFIVQNYDKDKLEKNKKMIQKYNNQVNTFKNVHFIFNQMMCTTTDREFLLSQLVGNIKKSGILDNEDIEIPFNQEDFINVSINKFNGHIKLKNYSNEFKQALYQLINLINKVESREFRKVIERRF